MGFNTDLSRANMELNFKEEKTISFFAKAQGTKMDFIGGSCTR